MVEAQTRIEIAGRAVGQGLPCFLIAEVGQNHDGSLGQAHAFIDLAADLGADAVKFQTHIADAESTLDEPFRVAFSRQDDTRYAYWQRMEFSAEQWQGLFDHARQRRLVFLSSAFSVQAVQLLQALGMPAWKLGSGEILSADLIDAMLAAGGPLLLSSGMSRWAEIDDVIARVRKQGGQFAVFQCTSRYPVALEEIGFNVLEQMQQRYHCPVGLSDHSGVPWPALAAIARGAAMVEVHLTMHKHMFGPDVASSLTPDQFKLLVDMRDATHTMLSNPVDKDLMAEQLAPMRQMFGKSLALRQDQEAGTCLAAHMLCSKKPASGIPPAQLDTLIGRRLRHAVPGNRLLREDDLHD